MNTSGCELNTYDDDINNIERLVLLAVEKDELININNDETNNSDVAVHNNKQKDIPKITEDKHFLSELNKTINRIRKPIENQTSNYLISNNNPELDSSDDEDVRNYLKRKYNDYGENINSILKETKKANKEKEVAQDVINCIQTMTNNRTPSFNLSTNQPIPQQPQQNSSENLPIFTDPIFGIRIIRPLISSTVFKERMTGRKPVSLTTIKQFIQTGNGLIADWVITGVIVNKSPVRTSKKGAQYSIWKVSDLKGDCSTISVFLFSMAHKQLWKTAQGTVVAILNANIFDKQEDRTDLATLSVDSAEKFIILGQSKDLGQCKSRKKNGQPCTAIVNLDKCEYCVYHVRQEYNKSIGGRSELQSATAGRGLQELRNKVLGKSEIFYAGKSFVAAKVSLKQKSKDEKRLMTLSEYYQSPYSPCMTKHMNSDSSTDIARKPDPDVHKSKVAASLEVNVVQRQKDLQRLKMLICDESNSNNTNEFINNDNNSTSTSVNNNIVIVPHSSSSSYVDGTPQTVSSHTRTHLLHSLSSPILSTQSFSIEVTANLKKSHYDKQKALQILKEKPIEKSNPNFIKYRGTELGKKRLNAELCNSSVDDAVQTISSQLLNPKHKHLKITDEAERFRAEYIKKIINQSSAHTELIQQHEYNQKEKYFNRLEKREAMEEKMLNTFSIECKAVVCLKCRYTAFSASDLCKDAGHPLKWIDSKKRFFQCEDCSNRTATLHRLPTQSCKTCKSSKWKRTSMIRERNQLSTPQLSIRGDEEKFIGGVNTTGNLTNNLNLLVPEE